MSEFIANSIRRQLSQVSLAKQAQATKPLQPRRLSGQLLSQRPQRVSQSNLDVQKFQGRGQLDRRDRFDPNFRSRFYYEDWNLPRGVRVGDRLEVSLTSGRFDAFLYLADGRTRRGVRLLTGLDTLLTDGTERLSRNARLVFTIKSGINYFLRASSTQPREQGSYTIRYRVFKPSSTATNFFYGSGLIDAAAAVASATGRSLLPATALGGDDWGRDLVKACRMGSGLHGARGHSCGDRYGRRL